MDNLECAIILLIIFYFFLADACSDILYCCPIITFQGTPTNTHLLLIKYSFLIMDFIFILKFDLVLKPVMLITTSAFEKHEHQNNVNIRPIISRVNVNTKTNNNNACL